MKRMNKVLAVILSLAMMITIAPANNGTSKAAEEAASGYAKIHDPSIVIGYYEGETYSDKSVVYGTQNADNSRKKNGKLSQTTSIHQQPLYLRKMQNGQVWGLRVQVTGISMETCGRRM